MGRMATTSVTCMAAGAIALAACSPTSATVNTALSSDEAVESYSLGVAVARQAMASLGDVDDKAFVAGVADAMAGAELAVSTEDMMGALGRYDEKRAAEARQTLAKLSDENRSAGDAFRAEFSQDPEVVTTASGLQYKVIEAGEGAVPTTADTVTLHYRGTLIDGREIDSTHARGAPVTLAVDGLLPGWTEALTLMPVGSTWQVVLPPELAFGENGAGPMIGPATTVVFEMELVSIG